MKNKAYAKFWGANKLYQMGKWQMDVQYIRLQAAILA